MKLTKKIFLTSFIITFVIVSILGIISTILYEITGGLFYLMIISTGLIVIIGVSFVIYCIIEVIKLIWKDC